MADKRITDLPILNQAESGDYVPIVDSSMNVTKRVAPDKVVPIKSLGVERIDGGDSAGVLVSDGEGNVSVVSPWWEEIGRATLSAAGKTFSVSGLPYRKYLKVLISAHATGGPVALGITFNGSSSGYARRRSENGGSEATVANTDLFFTYNAASSQSILLDMDIINIPTREKIGQGMLTHNVTNSATNLPTRVEFASKWANSSSAISSIQVTTSSTGDFAEESEIIVLGHN